MKTDEIKRTLELDMAREHDAAEPEYGRGAGKRGTAMIEGVSFSAQPVTSVLRRIGLDSYS